MIKGLLSLKAVLLAVIIALSFTLFIGLFANAPANMDASFSGKYWYYLNRGYPEPWAGVGLASSRVDFPLVRLPFLSADDGRGTKLVKVVDTNVFIPIFIFLSLFAYIPSLAFAKAVDKDKKILPFFKVLGFAMLVIALFIYFTLFSRV